MPSPTTTSPAGSGLAGQHIDRPPRPRPLSSGLPSWPPNPAAPFPFALVDRRPGAVAPVDLRAPSLVAPDGRRPRSPSPPPTTAPFVFTMGATGPDPVPLHHRRPLAPARRPSMPPQAAGPSPSPQHASAGPGPRHRIISRMRLASSGAVTDGLSYSGIHGCLSSLCNSHCEELEKEATTASS
nr:vegetative cell wall protein gp1-like [Aegilops tauschii subsp. strangulata]